MRKPASFTGWDEGTLGVDIVNRCLFYAIQPGAGFDVVKESPKLFPKSKARRNADVGSLLQQYC